MDFNRCRNPVYFQDFFNVCLWNPPETDIKVSQSRLFSGFFQPLWELLALHWIQVSQSRLFSGFFQLKTEWDVFTGSYRSQSRLFSGFFQLSAMRTARLGNLVAIPFIFRIFSTKCHGSKAQVDTCRNPVYFQDFFNE